MSEVLIVYLLVATAYGPPLAFFGGVEKRFGLLVVSLGDCPTNKPKSSVAIDMPSFRARLTPGWLIALGFCHLGCGKFFPAP
jgi:hypothetical protein